MAETIEIPDFDFSKFYYAELLEELIRFKRLHVPELTEESAYEPFIQLLRAFALVGHQNNTLVDLVANESTLPTAKLAETVRNMLRLIDYELKPATPAQVDIIYELAKVLTASTIVVNERAQAAIKKVGDNPIIYFEALEALSVDPTNVLTWCLAEEDGIFTDYTSQANSGITPADDFTPWATPAVKDKLYLAHAQVMWNKVKLPGITTPASGITGVWEFYDGNFQKTAPTSITDNGSNITVDLTSYLGTFNRQGTMVRVILNETGSFEDVESVWTGSANVITTTGLLGQTTVDTDPTHYTVGSDWEIIAPEKDEIANFTASGDLEYPLPQSLTQNWASGEVDTKEAVWLRYRIVAVSTPTPPTLQNVRIDDGKQFVSRLATQGRTKNDSPLGSSTGLPNQEFATSQDHYINGSMELWVDDELWGEVENFLTSEPTAKVYTIELGANDRATVKFGDGFTGRIPPIGVGNIRARYRYGADSNGNVGALTVTVDKNGLPFVNKLYNPRQGNGWKEADAASEESLERAKIAGPASLRTKDVALGPDDVVELTIGYVDPETGASPYARARAFEESFGPKTIEVTVVATGGTGLATAEQLAALDEYFNGDQFSYPPKPKRIVANQEVTAVNFTPKVIDVTATVYGKSVTVEQVENRLKQIIQPLAVKEDGVTWEWDFGGEVDDSRVMHEIFEANETINRVELASPAGTTALLARELPQIGTVNITIIEI
jgi:hypothetical protein